MSEPELRISLISQIFAPKPVWTVNDVPEQAGRTVLITGSNRGIGRGIARTLLSKGARVYIAARDEKGRVFLKLDLADLPSIKSSVAEFTSKEKELHTLYNNGALAFSPAEIVTKQGYDGQFGTNVLGHYYLTELLMPTLIHTGQTSPPGSVRVVTVSSFAHNFGIPTDGLYWDSLGPNADIERRKQLGRGKLYSQSKLLPRRVADKNIVCISVHPGGINSNPATHNFILRTLMSFVLDDVTRGAITPLYAGTAPAAAHLNGKYLTIWARVTLPSERALDVQLQKKLWEWCEAQVKDL
ncbi:NAD(P)-binding protein [Gloeopeniophorella convolvens]|nr:NAD(P)-binding protein [Gloeopeniophorella convolvens]